MSQFGLKYSSSFCTDVPALLIRASKSLQQPVAFFYVFNEACLTFVFGAEEQKSRSCCWVVGGKREAVDRAAKIYYS